MTIMNLALQKRHEQLERWRQNEEANLELVIEQQQADGRGNENNSSTQQFNRKTPSDISTPLRNVGSDINRSTSPSFKSYTNKQRDESKPDSKLKVKFSNSTLFLTACANGDLKECERLLGEASIDINVTTCDGLTGLHEAAICGNAPMVEYLINEGANINCLDNEGWTPLHAAASLGQARIVEILLKFGADVTIVNCENLLAYDLARNDEVQQLIGERLHGLDIDYLRSQEERLIKQDIERWIKTGHYDERSHPATNATVLHVLAAKGYVDSMKQILETPILKKQINLEAKDNEGFTPLLAASFWSQTDIVGLLIEHGANIFAQANNGYKISSIARSSLQSLESRESVDSTKHSTISSNSPELDDSYDNLSSVTSGSAPRHLKQGHLLKSRSLEISQKPDSTSVLPSSLSVDRLLARSESMTERELKRSYKELVMENERLRCQLKGTDDREKERQQEWIRKERQLQRKISELEEENRQLEHWKQEIQRLKDENSSLIRVVSKLSKKQ